MSFGSSGGASKAKEDEERCVRKKRMNKNIKRKMEEIARWTNETNWRGH